MERRNAVSAGLNIRWLVTSATSWLAIDRDLGTSKLAFAHQSFAQHDVAAHDARRRSGRPPPCWCSC